MATDTNSPPRVTIGIRKSIMYELFITEYIRQLLVLVFKTEVNKQNRYIFIGALLSNS